MLEFRVEVNCPRVAGFEFANFGLGEGVYSEFASWDLSPWAQAEGGFSRPRPRLLGALRGLDL
jgi:hypothetical protein